MSVASASWAWIATAASAVEVLVIAGPSRRAGRARRPRPARPAPATRASNRVRRLLGQGAVVAILGVSLVFEPFATIVAAGGIATVVPVRRHLAASARRRRRADALPELIDLLVLTMRAGHTAAGAVAAAADVATEPVRTALDAVIHRMRRGERLVDAVGELRVHLGDAAEPVIDAIVSADRFGLSITPALDELAEESRAARRRSVAADARAIPVRLAFPLVMCVLPAFALLTVAPVLLTAWHAISMPP